MDIKTIIGNNEQLAKIKKRKVNITNYSPEQLHKNAFAYYLRIVNSIVQAKNKKVYDYKPVEIVVKVIIAWMYTLEEFNYPKTFNPDDPDDEFKIDFQKGILLKGNTGVGKTLIFRGLQDLAKVDGFMQFNIVHAKKIASEFQNNGYEAIEKYGKLKGLVIDDIGTEPKESKYYGNSVNVIEELIEYRERLSNLTHATTNLDSMAEKYDDRTCSRANSLFNPIPLNHDKDYRLI